MCLNTFLASSYICSASSLVGASTREMGYCLRRPYFPFSCKAAMTQHLSLTATNVIENRTCGNLSGTSLTPESKNPLKASQCKLGENSCNRNYPTIIRDVALK